MKFVRLFALANPVLLCGGYFLFIFLLNRIEHEQAYNEDLLYAVILSFVFVVYVTGWPWAVARLAAAESPGDPKAEDGSLGLTLAISILATALAITLIVLYQKTDQTVPVLQLGAKMLNVVWAGCYLRICWVAAHRINRSLQKQGSIISFILLLLWPIGAFFLFGNILKIDARMPSEG